MAPEQSQQTDPHVSIFNFPLFWFFSVPFAFPFLCYATRLRVCVESFVFVIWFVFGVGGLKSLFSVPRGPEPQRRAQLSLHGTGALCKHCRTDDFFFVFFIKWVGEE